MLNKFMTNYLNRIKNGFGVDRIFSYAGLIIMFYVITNSFNKRTKKPTLMELFIATGKLFF
jgi:hypothetical protein